MRVGLGSVRTSERGLPCRHTTRSRMPENTRLPRPSNGDRLATIAELVDSLVPGDSNELPLARIHALILVIDEHRHLG